MNRRNPEERPRSPDTHLDDQEASAFNEKFGSLLPGIEFEETPDLIEAREVLIRALQTEKPDWATLQATWVEYAKILEEIVDQTEAAKDDSRPRAGLQIAAQVHKALLFYTVGDMDRYAQELDEACMYAYARAHNGYFSEVAIALQEELDTL